MNASYSRLMSLLMVFDPNPQWYFYTLHVVSVLSTVVFFIGILTVLAVRRSSINSSYRRLLLLNMTINYVMAIDISFGIMPIFPLPLTGGYGVGSLTKFNISSVVMATSALALGSSFSGSTVLLFLYRHNAILEVSRTFTATFYTLLAVVCVSPVMSFVVACASTDQRKLKFKEVTRHNDLVIQIPDFWSEKVLLASLSLPGFSVFAIDLCISIAAAGTLVAVLVYRMIFNMKKNLHSSNASKKHQNLVYTLIIQAGTSKRQRDTELQTATNYIIFLTPCILMMVCFYSDIPLPGLTNICAIVVSFSDPFSVSAMLLCHSDYRKFLLKALTRVLRRLHLRIGCRATDIKVIPKRQMFQ